MALKKAVSEFVGKIKSSVEGVSKEQVGAELVLSAYQLTKKSGRSAIWTGSLLRRLLLKHGVSPSAVQPLVCQRFITILASATLRWHSREYIPSYNYGNRLPRHVSETEKGEISPWHENAIRAMEDIGI